MSWLDRVTQKLTPVNSNIFQVVVENTQELHKKSEKINLEKQQYKLQKKLIKKERWLKNKQSKEELTQN